MKKLAKLLSEKQGYYKKSISFLAELTNLKEKTIERFRKTPEYKEGKKEYLNSVSAKKTKSINE